jgi:SAM-dependent methyltransferase
MIARLHTVAKSLRRSATALVNPRRRFNCVDQDHPAWDERAEAAVDLLTSFLAGDVATEPILVADLGCGNERLRRILHDRLQRPFGYSGYDLHPQSARVERLNVEREMPRRTFDVVFCLGLLEYLRDPELFARGLHEVCSVAVVSYVLADAEGSLAPPERRKRGWRTDYAKSELERVFEASGFAGEAFSSVNGGATGLWLWVRTPAAP